jgi:ribosomal protein L11 methylase PrmA
VIEERRFFMRFKVVDIILIFLLLLTGCGQENTDNSKVLSQTEESFSSAKPASETKELTIRNVTNELIRYTIKPARSSGESQTKSLSVGAIDRYQRDDEMDITFQQGSTQVEYRIDPGMPYSFRYDEDNKVELFDGSHGRVDAEDLAPFVPTPMTVVEKMLEMAEVDDSDIVYDLGCGDGRIVITAAKKYGAHGVGIDIDPQRIKESITNAKEAQVEGLVKFRLQDVTKANFTGATVVTIYLLSESNELLRPLLENQLKPGTYVVCHNYHIPGWEDKEIDYISLRAEDDEIHNIYLYKR